MMHFVRLPLCFLLLLFPVIPLTPSESPEYESANLPDAVIDRISELRAREHISLLAHDSLRGRPTPSPELEVAADYIANEFRRFGLEPLDGSYFHSYDLDRLRLDVTSSFALRSSAGFRQLPLKDAFIPYSFSTDCDLRDLPVVFVGYGISAPELNYDDYADCDVAGKLVVAMRGEPQLLDSASIFAGRDLTGHAQARAKAATAKEMGAAAFVMVSDPINALSFKPRAFDWPALYPQAGLTQLPFRPSFRADHLLPAINAGEGFITGLFGTVDSLRSLQQIIDSSLQPQSFELKDAAASLRLVFDRERASSRNVLGLIPGTEASDEFVVIGGHYDHVGTFYVGRDSTELGTAIDSICNGADDNASGTAAVMLVAEALASMPQRPRRSILFIAFSGEERGLFGSAAFVNDQPIDVAQVAAMFNLDMVGRNANDSLFIGGHSRAPDLIDYVEQANLTGERPFTFLYEIEEYFHRSDHWHFARKHVPSVFFFSGIHEDYHKPGDEIDKLNLSKIERVAKLCARAVWRIASSRDKIIYLPQGDEDER